MTEKADLPVIVKLALAILASLILFGGLALIALVGYQVVYADRIFPGVSVAGIDLSGLKEDEAYQALVDDLPYTYEGQIQLTYQDQVWTLRPIDLGFLVDPTATAQAALGVGRDRWLGRDLIDQGKAWFKGVQLAPVVYYDERIAELYLKELAAEIDAPMIEASLALDNTDVVIQNGQIGRQVAIDQSLQLLETVLSTLQDSVVPLIVTEEDPLILDASAQGEIAREMLSAPLVLTASGGEESWTLPQEDLAGMLMISQVEDGDAGIREFEISINPDVFDIYLNSFAPDLHRDPENTRFMFNDDTLLLEVVESAVIGRDLNVDASIEAINAGLKAGEHTIALQFDTLDPAVTDDMTGEELGITELVQKETSFFYGSDAARVQNIETAAAQFYGLLIAPGETFSMVDALGDISLENGYAEALIIYGDETIQGVGGGVCQVSSTLFRAAFFAGFPINERHAHAYRVGYYEYDENGIKNPNYIGLDATVYVPIVDMKFTNDTPYWLLMETYVYRGSQSLVWKFYSTKDGRTVDWDTTGLVNVVPAPDPIFRENDELAKDEVRKVDYGVDGGDVTIVRTVFMDGEVYFTDTFRTHFQAWQEIWEYGPGTKNPEDHIH
ncbi:MAG: VanW family protein [Anaerolineaceae bacterium]|nr:VanW family protein [Anaerolineaceae bacterium]